MYYICYICIEKDGRIICILHVEMLKYFSLGMGIMDDFTMSLFIRFFLSFRVNMCYLENKR